MIRFIVIAALLAGVALYIRHEFHEVITQITSTKTRLTPIRLGQPSQPSRIKCLICNGTGRTPDFTFASPHSHPTRPCPTCRGTGWLDNPAYGR